jgi:hypothetical protein
MCPFPLTAPDPLPLLFLGYDLIEPRLKVAGNRRLANLPVTQGSFEQEPVILQFIGGHSGQRMWRLVCVGRHRNRDPHG